MNIYTVNIKLHCSPVKNSEGICPSRKQEWRGYRLQKYLGGKQTGCGDKEREERITLLLWWALFRSEGGTTSRRTK